MKIVHPIKINSIYISIIFRLPIALERVHSSVKTELAAVTKSVINLHSWQVKKEAVNSLLFVTFWLHGYPVYFNNSALNIYCSSSSQKFFNNLFISRYQLNIKTYALGNFPDQPLIKMCAMRREIDLRNHGLSSIAIVHRIKDTSTECCWSFSIFSSSRKNRQGIQNTPKVRNILGEHHTLTLAPSPSNCGLARFFIHFIIAINSSAGRLLGKICKWVNPSRYLLLFRPSSQQSTHSSPFISFYQVVNTHHSTHSHLLATAFVQQLSRSHNLMVLASRAYFYLQQNFWWNSGISGTSPFFSEPNYYTDTIELTRLQRDNVCLVFYLCHEEL